MEFEEVSNVKYSCGCVHEIGKNKVGGWMATGKETKCDEHK